MSKINRNKIEQFLQWEGGQRLFNFAYSIGAAIVILGALFKILHLNGGNTLLMVGMGTEVLMFILTAFDRPPKEYKWENVFPALTVRADEEEFPEEDKSVADPIDDTTVDTAYTAGEAGQGAGGTRIYIAGGGGAAGVVQGGGSYAPAAGQGQAVAAPAGGAASVAVAGGAIGADDAQALSDVIRRMSAATEQLEQISDMTQATRDYMLKMAGISQELQKLGDTTRALNGVSEVLLDSYRAITENSENITRSSSGYVREMEALNKNVSGLNTIYEIQLKSVSSQLDAIDRVNRGIKDIRDMYEKSARDSSRYCEETEKMARYMQQLNRVYENMIHAMTVNMYRPPMGGQMPLGDEPADARRD